MEASIDQAMRSFVIFRLGSEEYGLSIDRVRGIIRYEEATPVPRAPESVMGVVNLRGNVLPVIDLCRRLGRSAFEPSPTARIIVAEGEGGTVGLAVDEANEVSGISASTIMPAPETVLSTDTADIFEGVAERNGALIIILDLDKAVPKSEYVRSGEDSDPEGGGDV
ncbi:MAG: chemotaxis protein CheW [Actinobacteria bacterium HGW-Actinobacteria-10]|nr:MAG: chemotaxis protein CheW [Actinobacteria bacterium HGW-Actinobacteria-10]